MDREVERKYKEKQRERECVIEEQKEREKELPYTSLFEDVLVVC